MNLNIICKPFLIYIVFSILITIYFYYSQQYKNIKKFITKVIKFLPDNEHEKILNNALPAFLRNPNSKQIIKNQFTNPNPNYIYMYLSSNALMFVVLFVLCEFKHLNIAWIVLIISIVFQILSTYFVSYILEKYSDIMIKTLKKNS